VKSGRWWLSLAYILATVLAQGVHDHGRASDDDLLESRGDCDEPRPHVAGHEVAGHGEGPTSCPSCHFRADHPLWAMAPRPLPGPSVAIPIDFARPSTLPGSRLRTRCRAPPLA